VWVVEVERNLMDGDMASLGSGMLGDFDLSANSLLFI
jgi:hypothetical protein